MYVMSTYSFPDDCHLQNSLYLASFPVPCPAFRHLQYGKREGPGTFPHVSDVKGRKTVERPKMNVGVLGLRTAKGTR